MQTAAMQANFTRRRRSTNHQPYHQHEPSRRQSTNDLITHHSNHQHDSSHRSSSQHPHQSYGKSSRY